MTGQGRAAPACPPGAKVRALAWAVLAAGISGPASAGLLAAMYDRALERAPDWQAAQAAHAAAYAAEPIARAEMRPRLQIDGGYGRSRYEVHRSESPFIVDQTQYGDTGRVELRLSQPVLDLPAAARIRQFEQTGLAADLDLLRAEQRLILSLTERYLDWLEAEIALHYEDAHLQALEQHLEQMRSREELGLATSADALLVQAERDTAAADKLNAAARLRSTREAIREIIGQIPDVPTPLQTPVPLATPEPPAPDPWVAQALEANPQVVEARIARDLALAQLDEVRGLRWPQLALDLQHQYTNSSEFQLGAEAETSRAELSLRLPLFDAGATRGRLDVAHRRIAQREAEMLAAQRAAERATRDAYDGVVTGAVRVRAARQSLQSAEAAEAAIRGRFDSGLATLAEQLTAAGQVRRALRDLATARHQYLLSRLLLAAAVGSLKRTDLEAIDALLLPR